MEVGITLRNYSEFNQYLLWNGHTYRKISNGKIDRPTQGIVGNTENNELVGIFTRNSEVFFLKNNKEYQINTSNFSCSDLYIDKKSRCFRLESNGVLIFETVYKPYIDPGILIYDPDPEEFDFLLFLNNNILQNKETLENFIKSKN